jgi:flagellar basal-body rod modification protein FlgD
MLGVQSVSSQSDTKSSSTQTQALGRDEFLTLLVAQLKNQDPLSPMESMEFTTQLAQFSSLEQLYNVNASVQCLNAYQQGMYNAQAVSLIGKQVVAEDGNNFVLAGDSAGISYELLGDAQDVSISIMDATGQQAAVLSPGAQNQGVQNAVWDAGDAAPGIYSYQVVAKDAQGDSVAVQNMLTGPVTGIEFSDDAIWLTVNEKRISMESVRSVKQ